MYIRTCTAAGVPGIYLVPVCVLYTHVLGNGEISEENDRSLLFVRENRVPLTPRIVCLTTLLII